MPRRGVHIIMSFECTCSNSNQREDPNRTIANVRPGKGKIVAQITFTNGAVKWAIIDKDRAVLLS
jgi:hypothetical protein